MGNISIIPSTYMKNILLVDGLKYNMVSISQVYDKDLKVVVESSMYIISSPHNDGISFIKYRHSSIYIVDLDNLSMMSHQYLVTMITKFIWY